MIRASGRRSGLFKAVCHMNLICHHEESAFRNLSGKYGLDPGDGSALFLLPGSPASREMEDRRRAGGFFRVRW